MKKVFVFLRTFGSGALYLLHLVVSLCALMCTGIFFASGCALFLAVGCAVERFALGHGFVPWLATTWAVAESVLHFVIAGFIVCRYGERFIDWWTGLPDYL